MAEVFISPTGDDSTGDGTRGNPYLTVAKCKAETSSMDTIIFLEGVYDANIIGHFNGDRNFVGDTGIPEDVIIDGTNQPDGRFFIGTSTAAPTPFNCRFMTFEKFTKPSLNNFMVLGFGTSSVGVRAEVERCLFRECVVWNGGNSAGGLLGTGQIDAIQTNVVFINCLMYNIIKESSAPDGAIIGRHGNGFAQIWDFVNCTFYLDATGSGALPRFVFASGNSAHPDRTFDLNLINCIIVNNQGTNVNFFQRGSGATGVTVIENSHIYSESGSYTNIPSGTNVNTSDDPLLISPQHPDRIFELGAGSTARYTGKKI